MRERKSAEENAAGRLRSIMPVVPRAVAPPPDPPGSGGGDLAEAGGPLSWSDIISGWPEDVDLEHVPLPAGPRDGFAEPPAARAPEVNLAVAPPYGGGGGERGAVAVAPTWSAWPSSALAAVGSPAPARPTRSAVAERDDEGVPGEWAGFPAGSAWATPPGGGRSAERSRPEKSDDPPSRSGDAVDQVHPAMRLGGMRSAAPERGLTGAPPFVAAGAAATGGVWSGDPGGAVTGAAAGVPPGGVRSVAPGGGAAGAVAGVPPGGVRTVASGVEATGSLAADYRKPLPPPAWVLPEPEEPPWPEPAEQEEDDYPVDGGLTAAGAFGRGEPDRARRLGAFDPGRRGVRALAAVAVLVIVVAALLAWRARPRVDPVAPPQFGGAQSQGEETDTPVTAAGGAVSPAAEVVVAVGGKVRKPGLVRLPPGARVADALTAAGGAEPGVDVALLNLARKVVDGELILVGVTPSPGMTPPVGGTAPAAGGPVNLNTATLADLDTLPGVGPVLAQRILDARDAQGGFQAVSDLRKVDGIGDARYEQLKDLVTV